MFALAEVFGNWNGITKMDEGDNVHTSTRVRRTQSESIWPLNVMHELPRAVFTTGFHLKPFRQTYLTQIVCFSFQKDS